LTRSPTFSRNTATDPAEVATARRSSSALASVAAVSAPAAVDVHRSRVASLDLRLALNRYSRICGSCRRSATARARNAAVRPDWGGPTTRNTPFSADGADDIYQVLDRFWTDVLDELKRSLENTSLNPEETTSDSDSDSE